MPLPPPLPTAHSNPAKDQWLQTVAAKSETVEVPGLGTVIVRELSLADRLKVERQAAQEGAASRIAILTIAACLNADGTNVFSPDDAHTIDRLPASAAARLTSKVGEINGLGIADEEEAKATKN